MVISHRYKYVFVEIPLTGSWAIRNELITYYAGESMLHKHAPACELRKQHPDIDWNDFCFFATVRNPLDEAVSRYFKLKTDHKGAFTDSEAIGRLESDLADQFKHRFVKDQAASFSTFFQKYHRRIFSSMIDLSTGDLNYVIRFENLQSGFSKVLGSLGIEQVRAIPVQNKTAGRRSDWKSYYSIEDIVLARRTFSPFMRKWDYPPPPGWADFNVRPLNELKYRLMIRGQILYAGYVRYNQGTLGKIGRKLRAIIAP